MGEPQYLRYPILSLGQAVFDIAAPSTDRVTKQKSLQILQDAIREHKMAPLYSYLAHPTTGKLNTAGQGASLSPTLSRTNSAASAPSHLHMLRRTNSLNQPSIVGVLGGKTDSTVDLPWDEKLYDELVKDNERELAEIQKEEDDAREAAGETELSAAQGKRAEFYARIGDKEKALEEFEKLFENTSILATKIDLVLSIVRLGLFFDDKLLTKKNIERAQGLISDGGDWERKNRLKSYQGLHLLTIRAYNLAAPLLLDSLSTFTSMELCSYSSLVVYATLAGTVALPRREFKTQVVDAPEIRAVFGSASEDDRLDSFGKRSTTRSVDEMSVDEDGENEKKGKKSSATPTAVNLATLGAASSSSTAAPEEPTIDFKPLASMIQSFYSGDYATFFKTLATVDTIFLAQDRYLFEHRSWFVREMRLRAYAQLLQSYKVVGLESMARSFGVSVEWLDKDLASSIAGGRLSGMIDRVKGIVVTEQEGGKNKQYNDVIKQGDALITKLQKYGQVVRLRGSERS